MLKQVISSFIQSGLKRHFEINENFRSLLYKNVKFSTRSRLNHQKINPEILQISVNRLSYHGSRFENAKPVILLSGILTFLGLKEKSPEEKESELIMTIKRGILMIQREKFNEAEQILHVALKLAQDLNDAEGVTYVYDVLANLAFETRRYGKAEKLFVNVLQRLMASGEPEDSNKVIHISLKLAKIFEANKEFKKAEQGYKFCLDALEKKLPGDDEDTLALWGMSMDWYSRLLLTIGRKNEALEYLKKAYETCLKVNGKEHEQTVVLLNDLGTLSTVMGDMNSAINYLQEAKNIGDKIPEMKDLASIYINLGQLYLMREMYNESKMACQEGMRKAKDSEDEVAISEAKQCLDKVNDFIKNSDLPKELKKVGVALAH